MPDSSGRQQRCGLGSRAIGGLASLARRRCLGGALARVCCLAPCSAFSALRTSSVLIRRRLAVPKSFSGLRVSYGFARIALMSAQSSTNRRNSFSVSLGRDSRVRLAKLWDWAGKSNVSEEVHRSPRFGADGSKDSLAKHRFRPCGLLSYPPRGCADAAVRDKLPRRPHGVIGRPRVPVLIAVSSPFTPCRLAPLKSALVRLAFVRSASMSTAS